MHLRQMNLNLLVQLEALLRTRNVTKAAGELRMSQSALSSALGRLRKDLDDPLLVRKGRELVLTPYAAGLSAPLSELLVQAEQLISDRPTFDPAVAHRHFTIIASDYTALIVLRPALRRLEAIAPGIRLTIDPLRDDYADRILSDEVDLVIVSEQLVLGRMAELPSRLLHEDTFVVAAWRGSEPLGDLEVSGLERRPFVQYVTGRRSNLADDALNHAGVQRQIQARTQSQLLIPYLLRGTRMVAMVPSRLAALAMDAAELQTATPPVAMPPIRDTAVWHLRRDADPGHAWLRDELAAAAVRTRLSIVDNSR